jgi:hypothetical protein
MTLRENMNPPRGVATIATRWGLRAMFCPVCEVAIQWTGHNTGVCDCNRQH